MSPLRSLIVFAGVLFPSTYAYVDFGSLTLPIEPLFEPTPRPEQLPEDIDLRYEILPSMITAVAPSVTLVGNGTHQTMYSLHYHHYFSKTRQGKGMFDKRGVFSGDPPVATCNPCGTDGVYTPTAPALTSNSVPCTTHTYHVSSTLFGFALTRLTGARVYLTFHRAPRLWRAITRIIPVPSSRVQVHMLACRAASLFRRLVA